MGTTSDPRLMNDDGWVCVEGIVKALVDIYGDGPYQDAMRVLKVSEEAGEAAQAYFGWTGQNPRKGVTHTREDVARELCDVILTAAVALHSFTDSPKETLDRRIAAANELARRRYVESVPR